MKLAIVLIIVIAFCNATYAACKDGEQTDKVITWNNVKYSLCLTKEGNVIAPDRKMKEEALDTLAKAKKAGNFNKQQGTIIKGSDNGVRLDSQANKPSEYLNLQLQQNKLRQDSKESTTYAQVVGPKPFFDNADNAYYALNLSLDQTKLIQVRPA